MLLLASKLSSHPALWENVQFQIVGFTVVMLTLATIWVTVALLGKLFQKLEQKCPALASTEADPAENQNLENDLPPETIAVIAAAVATVIQGPHTITSIQLAPDIHKTQAWALEGRKHIYATRTGRA